MVAAEHKRPSMYAIINGRPWMYAIINGRPWMYAVMAGHPTGSRACPAPAHRVSA